MRFHIEHTTDYVYSEPATESFSELRLRPRDSLRQTVSHHLTQLQPPVQPESYVDYFGNYVETLSIPFRHNQLTVTSTCQVQTNPHYDALSGLDLTIAEAKALYRAERLELYSFLRPSHYIPFTPPLSQMARELLPETACLATAIKDLNSHINTAYKYQPGVTDAHTTVTEFLKRREGVCQDFAHLMICLCRNAGIPARYVSGYIESDPPPPDQETSVPQLIGAAASHAWIEVYSPNRFWVGLDPTNNMMEGERHIQIGLGRDYHDVPPMKGVFNGQHHQSLSVKVHVMRTPSTPCS